MLFWYSVGRNNHQTRKPSNQAKEPSWICSVLLKQKIQSQLIWSVFLGGLPPLWFHQRWNSLTFLRSVDDFQMILYSKSDFFSLILLPEDAWNGLLKHPSTLGDAGSPLPERKPTDECDDASQHPASWESFSAFPDFFSLWMIEPEHTWRVSKTLVGSFIKGMKYKPIIWELYCKDPYEPTTMMECHKRGFCCRCSQGTQLDPSLLVNEGSQAEQIEAGNQHLSMRKKGLLIV